MQTREKQEEIRQRGKDHLAKGDLAKALAEFKRLAEISPNDLELQLQIADLLRKIGKEPEALIRYKYLMAESIQRGLLLQAIALGKLILKIDPEDGETQRLLEELSAKKEELLAQEETMGRGVPLIFADLSAEEFREVLSRLRSYEVDSGGIICKEGEEGESIYLITHGKVGIYKYNIKEKKEVLLNVLEDGDFFGEFSFFSHQRRSASARALSDVGLLEITKEDLDDIARRYPRITEVLLSLYKKRVVDTILALCPPFNLLTPQDRRRLVERFTFKVVEPQTLVIQQGALPAFLYLIKSGRAEVFIEKEGRELIVGHLAAGDIFGEISLLLGRNHTASVRTVTRTELLMAAKGDVEEILVDYPAIRETLKEYSRERLEEVRDKSQPTHDEGGRWV